MIWWSVIEKYRCTDATWERSQIYTYNDIMVTIHSSGKKWCVTRLRIQAEARGSEEFIFIAVLPVKRTKRCTVAAVDRWTGTAKTTPSLPSVNYNLMSRQMGLPRCSISVQIQASHALARYKYRWSNTDCHFVARQAPPHWREKSKTIAETSRYAVSMKSTLCLFYSSRDLSSSLSAHKTVSKMNQRKLCSLRVER